MEIYEIFKRSMKIFFRDPMMFQARLGGVLFLSLLISLLYWQLPDGSEDPNNEIKLNNYVGFLFFITVELFMDNIFPIVLTYPIERAVYLREENSKLYSTFSYVTGKSIQEFPFTLFIILLGSTIMFFTVGLKL